MSYQRKELQIIGGSFNLNPPGDKVPIRDYLLCQNFRVDRSGALRSRWGYQNYAAYPNPSGNLLHSAAVFLANVYWGSAQGDLYFGSSNTPVASGFDGNRLGMAGQLGWMWVINRSKQGRHNGTNGWQDYGIAAPASSPSPAAGGSDSTGPNGQYYIWVTFVYYDSVTGLLTESNPYPGPNGITVSDQDISLTSIPTSSDSRVNGRNVYISGGTLGQAYLAMPYGTAGAGVGGYTGYATIADNSTTTLTINQSDLVITNYGVPMPTTNDLPPAASGVIGPYFSRLLAWSTSQHPNRLFWTEVNQPQYWPGNASAAGNWADVGQDGEAILWVTLHNNCAVIYKQRSVWVLVGDPVTGYLTQVDVSGGITNAFAVTNAGDVDYFVAANALYQFNLNETNDITEPIRPLFNTIQANNGALTPPGNIVSNNSNLTIPQLTYKCVLGYAMGKLYLAYTENNLLSNANGSPILVLEEATGKWSYYRSPLWKTPVGGFLFDGAEMVAMGQDGSTNGYAANIDDFFGCNPYDPTDTPIVCVYQSHYEDCGLPDNQKCWLEVVVDCEVTSPDSLTVYAYFNQGQQLVDLGFPYATALTLGTIGGAAANPRRSVSFSIEAQLPDDYEQPGYLAKNISVVITNGGGVQPLVIHNVYLYYYVEARQAVAAASLPTDLGIGKVKQVKELQLDIDASQGAVDVSLASDLPGNQLAVRATPTVAKNNGRAVMKYPLNQSAGGADTFIEGFLWRVSLQAAAGLFRLYGVRLLARAIGVYVEAYEAAAGFIWDSGEQTFESGITHVARAFAISLAATPIKQFREIQLEIDTFNAPVTLSFLTDLPGDAQAVRYSQTFNSGSGGRRFFRFPLPAGTNAPIEGRLCRVQLSGISKFILYEASVEVLPYGVYLEAYEAAGGALYDTREQDLGSPNVKQFRELQLDIWADAAFTVRFYTDLPSHSMTLQVTANQVATGGRAKVQIPLPQGQVPENYLFGRLCRAIITSTGAFRLYGAKVQARAIGVYVDTVEASGGAVWDSFPQDLGNPFDKSFDELRFELDSDGAVNTAIYTDLPGEVMTARALAQLTTGATSRHWATVPLANLSSAAPPWAIEGRSIRQIVSSTQGFRLYRAQVRAARVGRYLAAATPDGNDSLTTLEFDFSTERVKQHKKLEIDLRADGAVALNVYANPNGQTVLLYSTVIATPNGRTTLYLPLPPGIRGRLLRIALASSSAARIYRLRVWSRLLNDPKANWEWADYPMEASDVLPEWKDIPVEPTPDQWQFAPFPVNPTPPGGEPAQWWWAKILSVEETPATWDLIDVPFEVVQ